MAKTHHPKTREDRRIYKVIFHQKAKQATKARKLTRLTKPKSLRVI